MSPWTIAAIVLLALFVVPAIVLAILLFAAPEGKRPPDAVEESAKRRLGGE